MRKRALRREHILPHLAAPNLEPVDVPEWGGTVYIRTLTLGEQVVLYGDGETDQADLPLRVLLHAIVDEDGTRIFADDDRTALEGAPFPVMMRLFTVAARLNGQTADELEKATRDFGGTPTGNSVTS